MPISSSWQNSTLGKIETYFSSNASWPSNAKKWTQKVVHTSSNCSDCLKLLPPPPPHVLVFLLKETFSGNGEGASLNSLRVTATIDLHNNILPAQFFFGTASVTYAMASTRKKKTEEIFLRLEMVTNDFYCIIACLKVRFVLQWCFVNNCEERELATFQVVQNILMPSELKTFLMALCGSMVCRKSIVGTLQLISKL